MYRILHTADWHIGVQPMAVSTRHQDYQQRRFEAAERAVALAKAEKVDAVVIAGDLFHRSSVSPALLHSTIRLLNRFAPLPVYLIPGNHDPLGKGNVWDSNVWDDAREHIHVCPESAEVEVNDDVALYPCPLSQQRSGADPTAWIPERDRDDRRIRIGLAHGSLQVRPDITDFPIPVDRAEESGLTYLALGHYHSGWATGRTAYSGGIEAATYKDAVGSVRIIDFNEGLSDPHTIVRDCGLLRWTAIAHQCNTVEDVRSLSRTIDGLGERRNQVLTVAPTLGSVADATVIEALDRLYDTLEMEVFTLQWQEDAYERAIRDDDQLIPVGLFETVRDRLKAAVEGSGELKPDVAKAALVELHRIARGVRR